ncbi:unnamed protein product [Prunus armeniaca]|uniref:Uncharacterized protein n=1 Tax=Prunus armeniaca TaxID=36596 RepID=A0A6J5VYM1_PRUAR|nr:unnamed protein product [Prunus armeniaca]
MASTPCISHLCTTKPIHTHPLCPHSTISTHHPTICTHKPANQASNPKLITGGGNYHGRPHRAHSPLFAGQVSKHMAQQQGSDRANTRLCSLSTLCSQWWTREAKSGRLEGYQDREEYSSTILIIETVKGLVFEKKASHAASRPTRMERKRRSLCSILDFASKDRYRAEGIKFLLISVSYSGDGFAVDGFWGTKGGAGEVDLGFVGTDMVDGFMGRDGGVVVAVDGSWVWVGFGVQRWEIQGVDAIGVEGSECFFLNKK